MKSILIIGMGKFGHHLCADLIKNGNDIMVMDKDEAKVKAAKTFIEFIAADPDQVKDSVLASTYFPVRASVGDIYADNAIMSEYTKFMAYLGDYYQITPGWATARTEWWNMLQRVGTGEDVATSVATFVQNANAAAAEA